MQNPFTWLSNKQKNFQKWCDDNGITLRDKLLITVGTMAILWYFISIIVVGCVVPNTGAPQSSRSVASGESPKLREIMVRFPFSEGTGRPWPEDLINFMAISITTISGTLATYLGLVLGISEVKDRARLSK